MSDLLNPLLSLFEYLFMFWLHRHLPTKQALNSKHYAKSGKNTSRDFKKIWLGTLIMTKLETLDVKKNLINSFLFVLKFLFSQPSKKNFIIHFGLASKKQSCKFLIWLPTEWYSKKIFCEEVSKNSIKKKLHAAMGKGTLLHSGLKW